MMQNNYVQSYSSAIVHDCVLTGSLIIHHTTHYTVLCPTSQLYLINQCQTTTMYILYTYLLYCVRLVTYTLYDLKLHTYIVLMDTYKSALIKVT